MVGMMQMLKHSQNCSIMPYIPLQSPVGKVARCIYFSFLQLARFLNLAVAIFGLQFQSAFDTIEPRKTEIQ